MEKEDIIQDFWSCYWKVKVRHSSFASLGSLATFTRCSSALLDSKGLIQVKFTM